MRKKKTTTWQNRIVGHGERPAKEFKFNPDNWRLHSELQKNAISAILAEIGWVTGVIVSVRSGLLIDGHARLEEALKLGPDTPVPYIEVDLSEDEEKKILAVLDPIGAMATADTEKLQEIFDSIEFSSMDLTNIVSGLLPADILEDLLEEKGPNLSESDFNYESKFGVIVTCDSEVHQQQIFNRLSTEGLNVKVVVV
jgi:hypothetical protein